MRVENDRCRYLEIRRCFFDIFGFCLWRYDPEY